MTRLLNTRTTLKKLTAGLCVALGLGLAAPSIAQADDEPLVTFKVLSPEMALAAATAALEACRADDHQVAVAVVDRFGVEQVILRDRYAGPHTPDTATRKARTAVSFRTPTLELVRMMETEPTFSGLGGVKDAIMLGGGLPIEAAGSIVGGIGISGAPCGECDETCAQAGIEAIEADIAF